MSKKSEEIGRNTSPEVLNISKHGFWLYLDESECFLPFQSFPWFLKAPIQAILNVQRPSANHLYWPDLDVDLEIDSLTSLDKYPLISKVE